MDEKKLIEDFDINRNEAAEWANRAYEIYANGDGPTEYESIEKAYDEYQENLNTTK